MVKSPDEDNYKILTSVIQYIRYTQPIKLTIECHTGIFMSIRKGRMHTSSCKQKLNTKSSTEAELVSSDDAIGQILLTKHLLAAQGVHVPTTTI